MEKARKAKKILAKSLANQPNVVGIGLTRWNGGGAVKVDLKSSGSIELEVIDVPIVIEFVGTIKRRSPKDE